MFSLFKKDLINLFGSTVSLIVLGLFSIVLSLFLWVFPGEYNLIDGGLAITDSMFRLSSMLFLVLIPVLTMRSFADERRQGTWDLLRLRPIGGDGLFWAKFGAVTVVLSVALLLTLVHPVLLSHYSVEATSIDGGVVATSYLGLLLWVSACVAIGLFASALSGNQVVAFVLALLLNTFFNFGFELLSVVPGLSFFQSLSDTFSLTARYKSMQRGVIDSRDLFYFASLIFAFSTATSVIVSSRFQKKKLAIKGIVWVLLLFVSVNWFVRFDFTAEKRYTLSNYTKSVLGQLPQAIKVNIYLDGDLNAGFSRLRNGIGELIDECNVYAASPIYYQYINPSAANSAAQREKAYGYLVSKGMKPISVNEADREGKMTQKLVFPWAELIAGNDTLRFSLLKNLPGKSGQENLNASLESLELQYAEILQRLVQKNPTPIAFLEGHHELPEPYVADAMNKLAQTYRIDRGMVGNDPAILAPYKVLIIAAPQTKFSETDKFVLDQYVMHGGRILWLVDGAQLPLQELSEKGSTTAVALDLNLNDLFFNYGLRINTDLLQDAQCISIPLTNPDNQADVYPAPWIYAPVLAPNAQHLITHNCSPVKSEFASSIDLVGENADIRKTVLLKTSAQSRVINLPQTVSYQMVFDKIPANYFDRSNLSVAVLLEGKFSSLYKNRFLPNGVAPTQPIQESQSTRMIVASTGSLIRNEIRKTKSGEAKPVPLGYEPYMDVQFGNPDFVVNAVQYLAGDEAKVALRSRQFVLRLLDKTRITDHLTMIQSVVMLLPVLLLSWLVGGVFWWRRRVYGRR
ncbi:MAG: gliding motility-associated ABC transporter substrate-binding protein GldG [Bacteroidales bacterium]|nr:gliding motility-associated ABC transporter substrate-binding protein GldG [Bacteroidales bacterium]